MLEDRKLSF